jgi:DHA3 family tetracycline resistance protein-like MFS transporter
VRVNPPSTPHVYLFYRAAMALTFGLMTTTNIVYQFQVAHIDAFGLLLVGAVLELTCLVAQLPTGLLADSYSRKRAVVAGTFLVGAGFLLEGLVPNFWSILLAQVIWGAGASLADGADDAWLTEEIGVGPASRLFLRTPLFAAPAGLVGILAGVGLAGVRLSLPIVAGGLLTALLAVGLGFAMVERNFVPVQPEHGRPAAMARRAREAVALLRASPLLLSILAVTMAAAAWSEGFDRLWQVHLLEDVGLPHLPGFSPLLWYGVAMAGSVSIGILVTQVAGRRIDLGDRSLVLRALLLSTTAIAGATVVFALAPGLPLAIAAYWVVRNGERVAGPVRRAWLNANLESATRATLFSIDGQVDALGQVVAGPALGLLARVSIPAALLVAALLLLPALAVFARLGRRSIALPRTNR